MALSAKRRAFVEHYLQTFNGTESARRAGFAERSAHVRAHRLLQDSTIQDAIAARLAELKMGTDEVLLRLGEQARADLGVFFKRGERWTDEPLPTQEILEEKVTVDADGITRRMYRVSQVCIDTTKLLDPRFSHLIKKFSDSPKNGLTVEMYDAQAALTLLGRSMGMFIDKTALTDPSGEHEYSGGMRDELERRLAGLAAGAEAPGVPGEPE